MINCNVDLIKQTKAILTFLPNGILQKTASDTLSVLHNFLKPIAQMIIDFRIEACALLAESKCNTADKLKPLWLAEYGLPNACDPRGETLCLLANGFPESYTLKEIIEDTLLRLGITADVIDESENNQYLTLSVIINENSDIFQSCFYVAGSPTSQQRICGVDFTGILGVANVNNPCDDDFNVANIETITNVNCGYNASDVAVSDGSLIASKEISDLIPNLSCFFEQVIPLGYAINFYFNNKQIQIEGI
jgi:hypothetical protein